ncbi:MAG: ATP phosphoribosyltransferase regulatory subunit [Anaerolineae bacterium]|nr:ATP phosphoribosyltransferase regulatory subunit [Anaerolineae bacterium]
MATRTPLHGKLPRGVQDLFLADAARRAALEARLATVFRAWGYAEIVPPTFEYYENLALGLGSQVQEATYRFLDHRGHTLALRPDLTVQTARIVGTKLYDQPMPLRFYYTAPVFRYVEVQAGRQREFSQAGIELIGAATPQADAEVVAVAVEALRAAGATDFRVAIGQVDFVRTVLTEAALPPDAARAVQAAVDRKSQADIRAALNGYNSPAALLLGQTPSLVGGPAVIDEARAMAPWPHAQAALDSLAEVYDWLARYGLAESIVIDLGEARGMDYYTGLTFEAFVAGVGFAVVNGGRYDRLVGLFGPPQPAVGFALDVERLMLALGETPTRDHLPHVLVAASDAPAALAAVARLRADGRCVEMDVLGRSLDDLLAYAAARGIGCVLAWRGDALVDVAPEYVR